MLCNSYRKIATPAVKALLLLPSLKLRELTFSMLMEIKLKLTQNIRTLSSSVANGLPHAHEVVAKKQAHP